MFLSNSALLSGLLYCACGGYMRPKLSKRQNAQGVFIYSYLCEMKEKSRSGICKMKNINGNMLDEAVCDEVKLLEEDSSGFIEQLKSGRQKLEENREGYGGHLDRLRGELADNGKEIAALVSSLTKASGTSAEGYIVEQIDMLHDKGEMIKRHIEELEGVNAAHALSDIEFDLIRQMLASFKYTLDEMGHEKKRAALRSFVKKIVWDGENIHIYY